MSSTHNRHPTWFKKTSHLFSWWFYGLTVWADSAGQFFCSRLDSFIPCREAGGSASGVSLEWWKVTGPCVPYLPFRLNEVCSYGSLAQFQKGWQQHRRHLEVWAWNSLQVTSATFHWSSSPSQQDSRNGETCFPFDGRSHIVTLQRGMGMGKGRELWCFVPSTKIIKSFWS